MAKSVIFNGSLIKCNRTSKEFKGVKGKEKLYLTLAEVELSDDIKEALAEAYKDAGKKFTPTWVSDFDGYVNLSTIYELPFKDTVNNVAGISIEDYIADGFNWLGAKVRISANIKDGAVYPKAIVIDEEGKEFDAFADFED